MIDSLILILVNNKCANVNLLACKTFKSIVIIAITEGPVAQLVRAVHS